MHRSPSRVAAWLGLFAILLLFIAPVIAKSLAAVPVAHTMTAGMEMNSDSHMQMAELSSAEHARMRRHHQMSVMNDSACGYCVLLAHLPLDLTNLPPLWAALQGARLPALPLIQPVMPRIIAHFFQPRAPPFL